MNRTNERWELPRANEELQAATLVDSRMSSPELRGMQASELERTGKKRLPSPSHSSFSAPALVAALEKAAFAFACTVTPEMHYYLLRESGRGVENDGLARRAAEAFHCRNQPAFTVGFPIDGWEGLCEYAWDFANKRGVWYCMLVRFACGAWGKTRNGMVLCTV